MVSSERAPRAGSLRWPTSSRAGCWSTPARSRSPNAAAPSSELGAGTRYRQSVNGPGGRAITADIEVTAYEPDTHLAFRTIAGPVRPRGDHTFHSTDNSTEVTFTVDAPLTGLKKLFMGNAVQKTMDAEVACLDRAKSVLESPS
ncbi:MAG: SRPBCC family protein [Gemmatimonadales bacterium]